MGTNVLTLPAHSSKSVTLAELQDLPAMGDVFCLYRRHLFSPTAVSELSRPMTPLIPLESFHSLLTINVLMEGMTAASPLRIPKQTFDTFLFNQWDFPTTEVLLLGPSVQSMSHPWVFDAAKSLNDFQQWEPNWNGAGALAFSSETLDTARDALEKIWLFFVRNDIRKQPNIVPLDDGSIRFEMVNGEKELFLTILGKSIEWQKWHPLTAVESEYQVIEPPVVERELEWLAA